MKAGIQLLAGLLLGILTGCSHKSSETIHPPPLATDSALGTVQLWTTSADANTLLTHTALPIRDKPNDLSTIDIDTTQKYQSMEGFGYTLTGGSASLINQMNAGDKSKLLQELFGNGQN